MKEIKLKLFLLIITLILFFILIEIGFRIFFPQVMLDELEKISPRIYRESDLIPFELKPNAVERHLTDEFDVKIRINSLGYRDNEFTNKKKILVLGDSFIFGWGVENNEAFTEKLEEKIDYEVINAGFASGITPAEAYLYLKEKGLKLKPDIVILSVSIRDDLYTIRNQNWTMEDGLPIKIKSNQHYIENNQWRIKRDKTKLTTRTDWFLQRHLHSFVYFRNKANFLFERLTYKIGGIENNCVFCEEFWKEYSNEWGEVKKVMTTIKELCDENNIAFYLMIVPRREQIYDDYWESYLKGLNSVNINRERPEQEFISFANENNIEIISILPFFRNQSNKMLYFSKDVHWNKEGHKLVAEIIYKKLINENLIPIPREKIEVKYVVK